MEPINVIGVGPGAREYLTYQAVELVRQSELIIGSSRALELFRDLDIEKYKIKNIDETLDHISNNREKKIVVLVSGDPGAFSLLEPLKRKFTPEEINVYPGISSFQVAFSRIKEPWHDAVFISLHGKSDRDLGEKVRNSKKIAILTDETNTPGKIAGDLLKAGLGSRKAWVCQNLSYPDETIIQGTIEEIADSDSRGLSVMIILE